MLGFEELDLVADLIRLRGEIVVEAERDAGASAGAGGAVAGRLQTRQQREEALRRQDLEHKSTPLAAHVNRGGEQYPHVYKSFESSNTLAYQGRKYALPKGTTQHNEDVSFTIGSAKGVC